MTVKLLKMIALPHLELNGCYSPTAGRLSIVTPSGAEGACASTWMQVIISKSSVIVKAAFGPDQASSEYYTMLMAPHSESYTVRIEIKVLYTGFGKGRRGEPAQRYTSAETTKSSMGPVQ